MNVEKALSELARNYVKYGSTSSKKVEPLHHYVADTIKQRCPHVDVIYSSSSLGTKEHTVEGAFYPKRCDITGLNSDGRVLFVVSVRAPWSNYQQNSNNLFEAGLGDCLNIQETGIPFHALVILPYIMPYRYDTGRIKKNERLTDKNIDKFRKLLDSPIRPRGLGLVVVSINEKRDQVTLSDVTQLQFSPENRAALAGPLSLGTFFDNLTVSLS